MHLRLFIFALLFCYVFATEEFYKPEKGSSVSEYDLSVAETKGVGERGDRIVKSEKFDKGGVASYKNGNKEASSFGAKASKQSDYSSGGASAATGYKNGGKAKGGSEVGSKYKKGYKKGNFAKTNSEGYNKKFGAIKTFGSSQGFKFDKLDGDYSSGAAAGKAEKMNGFATSGGLASFKEGGKSSKSGFAASGGAKANADEKDKLSTGFKKGGESEEQYFKKGGAFKNGKFLGRY